MFHQQKGLTVCLSSIWNTPGLRPAGRHKQEEALKNGPNLSSLRKKLFVDELKLLLLKQGWSHGETA